MRNALVPLVACLALCGAATTALIMSSANAQPAPHKPMMVAQADTAPPAPMGPPGANGRRGFNRPSPADMAARMKQMCDDTVARETGKLAYLETRLDLTASQEPLFQRWKTASLSVAKGHANQCNERVTQRQTAQASRTQTAPGQMTPDRRGAANPADRMAREEDKLKTRLADVQTERPALDAFYASLSPTQKTELARAEDRGRGRMRGSRFASASRGPQGPMGRGPMGPGMGQGPMGPGPMGPQTR